MIKEQEMYKKELFSSEFLNIADGETVFDFFLLSSIKYNSSSKGVKWLELRLEDCTGSIHGRVWSDAIKAEYLDQAGKVMLVKGVVNFYAGRPELTVMLMREMEAGTFDLTEVIRSLSEEMLKKEVLSIENLMERIPDPAIGQYVKSICTSERIMEMGRLPVHLYGHHSYRGGLLEHTLEVSYGAFYHAKFVQGIRMKQADLSLLAAGALLHDIHVPEFIGKNGYSCYRKPFDGLIGLSSGLEVLKNARKEVAISKERFIHLLHIIEASHEDGPKPKTLEAMAVRSANALSIEMNQLEETFRNADIYHSDSKNYAWCRSLDREVYRL